MIVNFYHKMAFWAHCAREPAEVPGLGFWAFWGPRAVDQLGTHLNQCVARLENGGISFHFVVAMLRDRVPPVGNLKTSIIEYMNEYIMNDSLNVRMDE